MNFQRLRIVAYPRLLPRTLSVRVALLLAFTIVVSGGLQYLLMRYQWRSAVKSFSQQLYWDVADDMSYLLRDHYESGIDTDALDRRVYEFTRANPALQLFLLSAEGHILYAYPHIGRHSQLSLEPLRRFLQRDASTAMPIVIPNPAMQGTETIFSVANIYIGDKEAYLLITPAAPQVLASQVAIEKLYLVDAALLYGGVASVLILGISGVLLFLVTRRFRALGHAITEIGAGNYDIRCPTEGDDEIATLGRSINTTTGVIIGALQQVKNSDLMRRNLFAGLSHDLRTPIGIAYASTKRVLADSSTLSTAHQTTLEKIAQQLEHVSALVRDIFELSKLESGAETLPMEEFSLTDLLSEEVLADMQTLATQRGSRIELHLPQENIQFLGNPRLLYRVCTNLIENALYYSPEGSQVVVRLECDPKELTLSIEDQGIGIESEALETIFEPYGRADSGRTHRSEGTGLGLAIVKRAVESHGGRIELDSAVGIGSCFRIKLPRPELG